MSRYLLLFFVALCVVAAQGIPAETDTVEQSDSLVIMPEMRRLMSDKWFAQDKLLHFSAGFAIPGLTYHFYVCRLDGDESKGKIYAVSLTALLAIGKELYDKQRKCNFSWKDLAWSGAGLTLSYFLLIH